MITSPVSTRFATDATPMSNRDLRRDVATAILVVAMSACDRDDPARYVPSAQKSLDNADYSAAIVELKKALKVAPNQANARFLLAKALLESGSPRDAETEARKALELNYPADDALPLLLRALLREGEYKKVVAEPDRRLIRPVAHAEVETLRALAHLAMRDEKSTRAALASALVADPSYTPAKIAQVRLAMAESDLPGALELANGILAVTPNAIDALVLKAELESALGRRDEGVRTLERAVEIQPNDVAIRSTLIVALFKAGRVGDADRRLAEVKKFAPNHPRTWYSEALLAYSQGNMPAAQTADRTSEAFRTRLLAGALSSGAHRHAVGVLRVGGGDATRRRGQDARRRGRAAFARYDLRSPRERVPSTAIRSNPCCAARRTIRRSCVPSRRFISHRTTSGKAAEYFAKADKLDSGNVAGRIRLAQAKLATGDSAQAIKDLEALAAAEPVVPDPDLALINAHVQLRDFDKALVAVARLEKKQPSIAATHNAKGVVYMARDDRKSARASFEKAVSLDPDYAASALNLGKLDRTGSQLRWCAQTLRASARKGTAKRASAASACRVAGGNEGAARRSDGHYLARGLWPNRPRSNRGCP